jgi:hypothetical protein
MAALQAVRLAVACKRLYVLSLLDWQQYSCDAGLIQLSVLTSAPLHLCHCSVAVGSTDSPAVASFICGSSP